MDLTCTGRGIHLTDAMRDTAAHKLAKLDRLEPRISRVEVEIIVEKNPRLAHLTRLEASLRIPRKTFLAHAEGPDLDDALDQLVERLERQIRDHHGRRRARILHGARSAGKGIGLESAHAEPADADTSWEAGSEGA
jgi:ribosomal subunit interface protein